LARATQLFAEACAKQSQHFEQKASRELEARVRQWRGDLDELLADDPPSMAYFRSDVEVRAIIAVILNQLPSIPIEPEESMLKEVDRLDRQLEKRWTPGGFIWPAEWEPAYPRQKFWWLYGRLSD
jgi:hypothetical protein